VNKDGIQPEENNFTVEAVTQLFDLDLYSQEKIYINNKFIIYINDQ